MKPLISLIVATYNEAAHIEETLRSLLVQRHEGFDLEILIIDGESTDDTAARVMSFVGDRKVRLLNNPSRTAPAAFNIGLRAAAGEYVCILGAHATYSPDYIEICYRELLEHNATGCSGRVETVPADDTVSAKLAAWCLGHSIASSRNSVRTQGGGFVETIPYPLFRKRALLELGGYNEQLVRNQDNDMNQRLRAAGHRLYLTSKTHATYLARPSVKSLCEYAFLTGKWNAFTLAVNAGCMRVRHFAPLAFTSLLAVLALAMIGSLLTRNIAGPAFTVLTLILLLHFLIGLIAAIHVAARERTVSALLLPWVILGFHLAYGLGTLAGSLCLLRGASPMADTARASVSN